MRVVDRCPACDNGNPQIAAVLDAAKLERFVEFDRRKYGGLLTTWLEEVAPLVLRCPSCGHCWYKYQPEPRQLAQMYGSARSLIDNSVAISRDPTPQMVAEMRRLRSITGGLADPPVLLDYGSGFGRWARAAIDAGFQVVAFEPSQERGGEGGDVPFELVHDLQSLHARQFDAIQLEQVLEHVPDPLTTLKSLRDLCHSRTVLRVTVPNIFRATEGRDIWRDWPFNGSAPHILAPFEHLHGFTPASLRMLAVRAGFRPSNGLGIWNYYPANQVRRLLGRWCSSLGTTRLLLLPT